MYSLGFIVIASHLYAPVLQYQGTKNSEVGHKYTN